MDKIIIKANMPIHNRLKELWQYRELFGFLAWRDLSVRYKQTVLGVSWSIIRPLITTVVFTVIFGKLAKLPSENVPYLILVYVGMLPWQFFSSSLSESSGSVVANSNVVTKVYFPRIIIPTASTVVSFVDFLISVVILLALLSWYSLWPDWKIVTIPFFLLITAMTSLGIGYWVTALNVKYRDFRYIIPFMIQLGFYISPVGISSTVVPEKWRFLYSMNPMVGVIDGFRWALLGGDVNLYMPGFIMSVLLAFGLLLSGVWFFMKTERKFADVI